MQTGDKYITAVMSKIIIIFIIKVWEEKNNFTETNFILDIKVDEADGNYTNPSENDSLYRPKINRDASTIDQVYNIENVVPKSVLDTLFDEAKKIMKGVDLEEYR